MCATWIYFLYNLFTFLSVGYKKYLTTSAKTRQQFLPTGRRDKAQGRVIMKNPTEQHREAFALAAKIHPRDIPAFSLSSSPFRRASEEKANGVRPYSATGGSPVSRHPNHPENTLEKSDEETW